MYERIKFAIAINKRIKRWVWLEVRLFTISCVNEELVDSIIR